MVKALAGLAAIALAGGMAAAVPASAAPFSAVYVFGDSLSDTGNLAETVLQANFPNPPSFHDSYTNGPVAVELLAQHFGLRADPSLFATGFVDKYHLFAPDFVSGTNYAVAGAAAGNPMLTIPAFNLPGQVSAFLARVGPGNAPASALYTMLIGGNDVRIAAHMLDPTVVQSGVASELTQLQTLISNGAKTLLVSNVPDVGAIPEFTQESSAAEDAAAHAYSLQYDAALAQGVSALRASNPDVTLDYFDLYSFANQIVADAASLGFTNTTDPCYAAGFPPTPVIATPSCGPADPMTGAALNIDSFLYWDHIHPTAHQQALWANGLIAAVPEPATLAMLGAGLAGLLLARRRQT